jgi:hypothetical protein
VSPRIQIERWVVDELSAFPLSRAAKLKFLIDLRTHLPANYLRIRGLRCENDPTCFWYSRLAEQDRKVHMVRLAVDDSSPDVLRVVWAVHVGA